MVAIQLAYLEWVAFSNLSGVDQDLVSAMSLQYSEFNSERKPTAQSRSVSCDLERPQCIFLPSL